MSPMTSSATVKMTMMTIQNMSEMGRVEMGKAASGLHKRRLCCDMADCANEGNVWTLLFAVQMLNGLVKEIS